MKTLLTLSLAALVALPAFAKLSGNGYYRVHNYRTDRYVYVLDNKGSVDYGGTTADVNALQLWKDLQKAVSDPATVIYFEKHDSKWDLAAQGTSVNNIISAYVSIAERSDGTYMCYGTKSGLAKYLGDKYTSDDAQGEMTVDASGDVRKWWIDPVDASGDNYFGIKPTETAGSKYYRTFYASFPFSAKSSGMKFYRVSLVSDGMAVIEEITGVVPGATPVLVECSKPLPTDNRLNIGGSAPALNKANKLTGVYFQNHMVTHRNLTPYDPKTMRVLGTDNDGKIAFVNPSGLQYIEANQAYLNIPSGSPDVIRIVSQAEYDEEMAKQPTSVTMSHKSGSLTVGETLQLTATVAPAAAAGAKLTWTSSKPDCAAVSSTGLVTAKAKGSVTITASTDNGKSASCTITVAPKPEGVSLSETNLSVVEGNSVKLTASVKPGDVVDKTITWKSSEPAVATVDSEGNVTGVKEGKATVTASAWNGVSATCSVTVTPLPQGVTLSETELTLTEGESATLTATVTPAAVADKSVTWSSSAPSVASVSSTGKIEALSEGNAIITATASNGVSAGCAVTVNKLVIEVKTVKIEGASSVTVTEGAEIQLTATVSPANATYPEITWSSNNEQVAEVSATGIVKALSRGVATVTASTSNGRKASVVIAVQKKDPEIIYVEGIELTPREFSGEEGTRFKLEWNILPENATNRNVTLTSDRPEIVTVDKYGNATILKSGNAIITIMTEDGAFTDNCYVTGIAGIATVSGEKGIGGDLYRIDGTLVKKDATADDLRDLPKGIYILGNRKIAL